MLDSARTLLARTVKLVNRARPYLLVVFCLALAVYAVIAVFYGDLKINLWIPAALGTSLLSLLRRRRRPSGGQEEQQDDEGSAAIS